MRSASRIGAAALAAVVSTGLVVAPASAAESTGPKNIIYMIGDGMGYGHIASTNLYESGQSKYIVEGPFGKDTARELDGESVQAYEDFNRLSMATYSASSGKFDPEQAWTNHDYFKSGATDSAAAGTAMATGTKVNNGVLGVSDYGHAMENISERATREGKAAGVVSTVQYNHATPAAFAAHNKNRNNYLKIGQSMIDSDLSLIMGAGHPEYDDNAQKLAAPSYEYTTEENLAKLRDGSAGWEFAENTETFEKWANGEVEEGKKYFGLAPVATTLQQHRDEGAPKNDVVDLPTMTKGALNVLGQDKDGFSVMIEGGAIDWAGHANQTGRDIEETQDFNAAVDAAIDWVEQNSSWDETLLIVTADHETGFLSGPDEDNSWNKMTGTAGSTPNVGWYSEDHTNQVVPFFFKGAGSEDIKAKVSGRDYVRGDYIDNTTVANLVLNDWWFNTDISDDDNDQPQPAPAGSSNGLAGLLGGGIVALVLGVLAALANAVGLVQVNPQALRNLFKF